MVPPTLVLSPQDITSDLVICRTLTVTKTTNSGQSNYRANDQITSGRWYWEFVCNRAMSGTQFAGVSTPPVSTIAYVGATSTSWGYASDGTLRHSGGSSAFGATWTTGDILGFALDADKGTLTAYKNNAIQGSVALLRSRPAFASRPPSRVYSRSRR